MWSPIKFQNIKLIVEDRVARITFARPPLNIFNIAMMREILAAVNEGGQQRDVAAIVFEAAPGSKSFSAGVAVEEHVPETVYQMLDTFHSIFRTLYQTPKPTIAVVDGPALGGGCELVAACDLVIASNRSRFGQPEIKLGVFPPIAAILLPRIIGEKRAAELVLTGELIEADEALRLGLVNYVVPPEELPGKTGELLAKLRDLSAAALSMARAALDIGRRKNFEVILNEVENLYLHELMKTADANEGVRAFMEKRRPQWRNK
jgi:cyclohexa-1,5-dienecarbonyl-CoA hydratase